MSAADRKIPAMFGMRQQQRKQKTGKGDKIKSKNENEDDELAQALALSAAEAQLASMNDDERLQAALAQSLSSQQDTRLDVRPSSSSSQALASSSNVRLSGASKRKIDEEAELDSTLPKKANLIKAKTDSSLPPLADVHSLSLEESSFNEARQHEVKRLNGSLDLLVCKGWIRSDARKALHQWMLSQLAWHRVTYIRPSTKQRIVTPRFTATFGKDDTGAPNSAYRALPKPFPDVLARLRDVLQRKTGARFNAIIINYYSDGNDAISYHSDDEAFLGVNPTIASVSLGASRDFYLRRKAAASKDVPPPTQQERMGTKGKGPVSDRPMEKMVLEDGDLLVMRGKTQADWEHSIPKRARHVGGRINMTFRRVVNVSGTNSE